MATMSHKLDGEFLTIAEATARMGCSDSWTRTLIREGRLRVRTFSERLKLVPVAEADRARDELTTRAKSKKHLAKRPASKRAASKRAASKRAASKRAAASK